MSAYPFWYIEHCIKITISPSAAYWKVAHPRPATWGLQFPGNQFQPPQSMGKSPSIGGEARKPLPGLPRDTGWHRLDVGVRWEAGWEVGGRERPWEVGRVVFLELMMSTPLMFTPHTSHDIPGIWDRLHLPTMDGFTWASSSWNM